MSIRIFRNFDLHVFVITDMNQIKIAIHFRCFSVSLELIHAICGVVASVLVFMPKVAGSIQADGWFLFIY